MNIYITGDTHGMIEVHRILDNVHAFPQLRTLTPEDVVVVLGDFALPWMADEREKEIIAGLAAKPWTTAFIDGNHECFPALASMPTANRWGADVGVIAPNILHLRRGRVYDIGGTTFWCMGGALSIDRAMRVRGVTWFEEEMLSRADEKRGLEALAARDFTVDYVLTHAGPCGAFPENNLHYYYQNDAVARYLDYVYRCLAFRRWFVGHYHKDHAGKRIRLLYQDFVRITPDSDGGVYKDSVVFHGSSRVRLGFTGSRYPVANDDSETEET